LALDFVRIDMKFRDDELEVLDREIEFEVGREFVHTNPEVLPPSTGDIVGGDATKSGVVVTLS
jgi:hypothetical protein